MKETNYDVVISHLKEAKYYLKWGSPDRVKIMKMIKTLQSQEETK